MYPITLIQLKQKYHQFYTSISTNTPTDRCVKNRFVNNEAHVYQNNNACEVDDDDDDYLDDEYDECEKFLNRNEPFKKDGYQKDFEKLTNHKIQKDNEKLERMQKSFDITYFESNKMNNRINVKDQQNKLHLFDFGYILQNINITQKEFYLNIQGAIVKKLTKNLFVSSNDTKLIVADFSSMYSSIMDRYNVCSSTLSFYSQYPTMVNYKMEYCVNDVNNSFHKIPIEIKTNNVMIPMIIYFIKREKFISLNSKIISSCRQSRNEIKKKIKLLKSTTSFEYKSLNLQQEFAKLLGNSFYGKQQDCKSPVFNPFCGAFVTKAGRGLLLNLFIFLRLGTKLLDKQNGTLTDIYLYYGDTDSVFLSGNEKYIIILIDMFNKLKKYDSIIQVEIEKILDIALFFNKKNYVMLY